MRIGFVELLLILLTPSVCLQIHYQQQLSPN